MTLNFCVNKIFKLQKVMLLSGKNHIGMNVVAWKNS